MFVIVIIWTSVVSDLCRYMASLSHNALACRSVVIILPYKNDVEIVTGSQDPNWTIVHHNLRH